jgi:SOS-response transcriptional repressor LexA
MGETRQKVLDFYEEHVRLYGVPPTQSDIAEELQISRQAVNTHVKTLIAMKLLKRIKPHSKSGVGINENNFFQEPVGGKLRVMVWRAYRDFYAENGFGASETEIAQRIQRPIGTVRTIRQQLLSEGWLITIKRYAHRATRAVIPEEFIQEHRDFDDEEEEIDA